MSDENDKTFFKDPDVLLTEEHLIVPMPKEYKCSKCNTSIMDDSMTMGGFNSIGHILALRWAEQGFCIMCVPSALKEYGLEETVTEVKPE